MKQNFISRKNVGEPIGENITKNYFPLTRTNFLLMAVSALLIVVGFLLMLGGANDGETFNNDIFSTRRIVAGPTMAFIGFVAMAISIIFTRVRDKKKQEANMKKNW